jgi:hypothetical protein
MPAGFFADHGYIRIYQIRCLCYFFISHVRPEAVDEHESSIFYDARILLKKARLQFYEDVYETDKVLCAGGCRNSYCFGLHPMQ